MSAAQWTYLVVDLATNVIIGNLPLVAPQITKVLNGSGTLTGTTPPLGDPRMRALNVYDMTTPARRAIYAVRDDTPWWGGIIWTRSYDSATELVSIGCADFWSYFDHRFVLPLLVLPVAAPTTVAGKSIVYSATEQNALAGSLVSQAQSVGSSGPGANIGVVWDGAVSNINRDRTYWGWDMATVGQRLRDLAGLIDGPDIIFEPGAFDSNGRPTRLMRTGTPRLGQQGTPFVWEHGGNMVSYTWNSDGTRMNTRTFAMGSGIDVSMLIAVAENQQRYTDGWAMLEGSNAYSTVITYATLQNYASSDLAVSRLPVALPHLVVRGDKPPRIGEFGVGDSAQVIIKDQWFTGGINTPMRVLGIDITPTEDIELVGVTMGPTIEDVM